MTIKYFSMFSGIGGFEVGMHKSKYKDKLKCVGYSEIDKYAISIYSRWFPNHRNYGDATTIDTSELDDFSLLIGGFPCQSFSNAGKGKGFNDCRGTLFFEVARVLQDKNPKYFLLENVGGLLSNKQGETFQKILEVFDELGYDVSWETHNSKNYGVPQNRERLFIKGYSRRECGREIFSFGRINEEIDMIVNENHIKKLNNKKQAQSIYDISGLSCTLSANGGGQGGKTGLYKIPFNENNEFRVRRLTPRECERLQGFKDDYTKFGKDGKLISDSQRYRCLGNAVTTNVVKHIFDNWDLKIN